MLAFSDAPGVADEWTFLRPYLAHGTLPSGLVTSTAAAVFLLLLLTLSYITILREYYRSTRLANPLADPTNSGSQTSARGRRPSPTRKLSRPPSAARLSSPSAFRLLFLTKTDSGRPHEKTFAVVWLITFGAVASSSQALVHSVQVALSLADGLVGSTELVLSVAVLGALLVPTAYLLRPVRMRRVTKALRQAKTPRQRFEGALTRLKV